MRNVVLVTIDSLRADHCSFMGYERDTTPTLDTMAGEGLAFTNAIAPGPSTPESMPAIFTGSHPIGIEENVSSQFAERQAQLSRHILARDTLAERFSRAGYATAGFSPNPYTSRYFGFDVGFDEYEDFIGGSRKQLYDGTLGGLLDGTPLQALFPARVALNWVLREEVFKPWEAFYERIFDWTRRVDEPYFLWVLLMDTHDPYLVPDDYRTQSWWKTYHANWRLWRQGHEPPFSEATHNRLVRAYDDSIRYADAFLERLRSDLSGDPIIAVHGDHGEAFGEHGTYGHHQRLYEENIHVPMVVDGGPIETVADPFSLAEIPRLLLELTSGGRPTVDSEFGRAQTLSGIRAMIRGRDWKFLLEPDGEVAYDLSADPDECEPLADSELYEVGRSLADRWQLSNREKHRVSAAVQQLQGMI